MSALTAAPTINHAEQSSEELLAEYAATRCERAFEVLFERHQEEVHNYLALFLCSHDDADDVSQEVFLLIHQQPSMSGQGVWHDTDNLYVEGQEGIANGREMPFPVTYHAPGFPPEGISPLDYDRWDWDENNGRFIPAE